MLTVRAPHFERGKCYFMLSYFDEDLLMPLIETYVYIGMNLLATDAPASEPVWYFKKPDQFLRMGYRLETDDLRDCITVDQESVELLLDLPELVERLADVAARDGRRPG